MEYYLLACTYMSINLTCPFSEAESDPWHKRQESIKGKSIVTLRICYMIIYKKKKIEEKIYRQNAIQSYLFKKKKKMKVISGIPFCVEVDYLHSEYRHLPAFS